MANKIKVSELPEFDAADYLASEEDVAAYLATVLEDGDPALLVAALGDIARAQSLRGPGCTAGARTRLTHNTRKKS